MIHTTMFRFLARSGLVVIAITLLPGLVCTVPLGNENPGAPAGDVVPVDERPGLDIGSLLIPGPAGVPGVQGPAGPQGAPGPVGTVTLGSGLAFNPGGAVAIDTAVLDGIYWKQGGNSGGNPSILGTSNNADLQLNANSQSVLSLNANRTARFDVNNGHSVTVGFNAMDNSIIKFSSGAYLTLNGLLIQSSDRALKSCIEPVCGRDMLSRLAAMPLSTWRFTNEPSPSLHIGPMAQDFHAAFGFGQDDRHLAATDAAGVALASIQGLHELVREKECEIDLQREKIASLESRLAALEALFKN